MAWMKCPSNPAARVDSNSTGQVRVLILREPKRLSARSAA